MGFMDKVKSQATALAEKAQEGVKVGQEKLSQVQAKRQSDALLLELGGLVYLQHSGRAEAGAADRVEAIVAELRSFEAEHGPVGVTPAVPSPGGTGTFVPAGAGSPAGPGASAPDQGATAPPPAPSGSGGIPTASYASDEDPPDA
jgi:hypothetical protein